MSLHIEADLGTELVVSLCFSPPQQVPLSSRSCARASRQVSVLSRERSVADWQQWLKVVGHLPPDSGKLDAKSGESCPRPYIDRKLVREDLITGSGSPLHNLVGFHNLGSAVLLPCSLTDQFSTLTKGSKLQWYREQADVTLATDGQLAGDSDRLQLLTSGHWRMDLLMTGVSAADTDVYTCVVEDEDGSRAVLSRLAVSSGDYLARPAIMYKSSNVTARKGQTASLECYVNGNPPPVLTWWRKDSARTEAYVQIEGQGPVLTLDSVDETMEGVYKCEASNGIPPHVHALLRLNVGFTPETEVDVAEVTAPLEGRAVLTCRVLIKSPDVMTWTRNHVSIKRDFRHSVSVIMTSAYHYELKLVMRRVGVSDYGNYTCYAKDGRQGAGTATVTLRELVKTGDECHVDRIPVMENFKIQKFLGDMAVMQATTTLFGTGRPTYMSQVLGFFVTVSDDIVHYYRGYSSDETGCLEPDSVPLGKGDTPGDYLMPHRGDGGTAPGRYKIVYTDYTHAVTYHCLDSEEGDKPCPPDKRHVQIVSRVPRIADHVLSILYRHVQSTCVAVSSLALTVPGICRMPSEFMYSKGWIGPYPEPNCQVASLQTEAEVTLEHVAGPWRLIGEVRGDAHSAPFRESVHIVTSRNKLALFYRSKRARVCSAVEVNRLHMSHTAGSYYHDHKGLAVDSKFLYVTADALVVYTCLALRHDGTCYPGSEHIELFHRRSDVAPYTLLWMTRAVANACIDVTRIDWLTSLGNCSVPQHILQALESRLLLNDHVTIGCHQRLIPVADKMSVNELAGNWTVAYRNMDSAVNNGHFTFKRFSKTYHIIKRPKKRLVFLMRHFERDWNKCTPTKYLEVKQNGAAPGNYIHKHGSHKTVLKVLWQGDDRVLIYWCEEYDDDGVCLPNALTVELLIRAGAEQLTRHDDNGGGNDGDGEILKMIRQIVADACVEPDDFLPTIADEQCSIPSEIITLAEEKKLKSDFDIPVLSCNGELLNGASKINIERLTGEWAVLWRNDRFWNKAAPKAESSFIILTSSRLLYLWRSYNNDLGRCDPEKAGKFMMTSGPGDYYSGFEGQPVSMKILRTDYTHMVTLWCHMDERSRCLPDRTTVEVLSRNKTMDNATRDVLLAYVGPFCLENTQWVSSQPDVCRVQNDVLTAAYIEGIDQDYSRIRCRVDLMSSQPGVDDDTIVGSWISVYQSKHSSISNNTAKIAFHFTKISNGSISLLYRLYSPDREACEPARVVELFRDTEKPGTVFQLRHCDSLQPHGFLYVIYADKDRLALLLCYTKGQGQQQLLCDPEVSPQLFVLLEKRGFTPLPAKVTLPGEAEANPSLPANSTLLEKVKGLAADACVDYLSLVEPNHEPCPIPQDILTDIANGQIESCTEQSSVQCYPRYIPIQTAFNITQFGGVWHTVRQTKYQWGNMTWRSTVRSFDVRQDGSPVMIYTGQPVDLDRCTPRAEKSLQPDPGPGGWTYTDGENTVTMKVVWTDYSSSALLYTCAGGLPVRDGLCRDSSLQVEFLSRDPQLTTQAEERLVDRLAEVCVPPDDVVPIITGLCPIITEQGLGVGSNTTGAVATGCRMQDLPLDSSFTLSQMTGVWYEIARTRFTSHDMESIINTYTYDPVTSTMEGLFIGTLLGQCLPPMKSQTRKKDPTADNSVIEARIQSGEIVYPWFTFRILYFDGDVMLHLACYHENEDGTCPRDTTEVTLAGRSRTLSDTLRTKLDRLMGIACLTSGDLVLTKEIANCMPVLPHTTGDGHVDVPDFGTCKVGEIPVVQNFNEDDLLGVWYALGSGFHDPGDANPEPPPGSILHVTRSTATTLQLRVWNVKNGSCDANPAVYMTAACPGSRIGDYISTRGSSSMLQWTTVKILRLENGLLLVYKCVRETLEGTCLPEGLRVDLLARSPTATADDAAPLLSSLPAVCLKPGHMKTLRTTDGCDHIVRTDASSAVDVSPCAVDSLPAIHFDVQEISGTWYEVARNGDPMQLEQKAVVVFQRVPEGQLQTYRSAMDPLGQCKGPEVTRVKPRCYSNPGTAAMGRTESPGLWTWAPWRVLHVDNSTALVIRCMDQQIDGSCSPSGFKLHFLSRSPNPDPAERTKLYAIVQQLGCFEGIEIEDVSHEGASCKDHLDSLLPPAA